MTESEFLKLPILSPDGTDFIDIPTLWNDGTSKLEAAIYKNDLSLREIVTTLEYLASQPGVTVTEEEAVGESGFSTWTTIITKESAELARQVDVESEENGKAVWTTTITIGDKTVTYLQKETEKGWVTTVS